MHPEGKKSSGCAFAGPEMLPEAFQKFPTFLKQTAQMMLNSSTLGTP